MTTDTITIPVAEYEALREAAAERDRLREELEDAEDNAELADLEVRLARDGDPGANYLPASAVRRMIEGVSPLRVWREHRGLTLAQLGEKAGIAPGYISEIETSKKPGSIEAWKALAKALGVKVDTLVD